MAAPELINLAAYQGWRERQYLNPGGPLISLEDVFNLSGVAEEEDQVLLQQAHEEVYRKFRRILTRLGTHRTEDRTLRWGQWLEKNGVLPVVKRVGSSIAAAADFRLYRTFVKPDSIVMGLTTIQTLPAVDVEIRSIDDQLPKPGVVVNVPNLETIRGGLVLYPTEGELWGKVLGTRGGTWFRSRLRDTNLADYRQFGELADALMNPQTI